MKLSEYLAAEKLDKAAFAAMIGVTQPGVHHWLRGDRTPRPDQMRKIVTATRGAVQPNDFLRSSQVPNGSPCSGSLSSPE